MSRRPFPRWLMTVAWLGLVAAWLSTGQARAQTDDETRILDIQVTGSVGAPTVYIKTSARPNTSVYSLSDPLQVVVDIANAVPDNAGLNPKGIAPVRRVNVQEFRDREGVVSRVSIGVDEVVEYTSETLEDGIVIRLKGQGKPANAGAVESDPLGEQLARMESGEAVVEEIVIATPTPTRGEGGKSKPAPVAKPSGSKPASTGSTAKPPAAKPPPAPSALNTEITGLDFLPYSDRSRVRVQTDRAVEFTTEEGEGDQIILNLPGVRVPKPYQRPLDTSEFASAVKMVSAYTVSQKEGARVVVKLRESVPWKATQDGTFIYLDFEVPAGYAALAAAQVAAAGQGSQSSTPTSDGGGLTAPAGTRSQTSTLISGMGNVSEYGTGGDTAEVVAGMGLFGTSAVYADPEGEAKFSGTKFSIDLREADIHNVFRLISAVSGVNIVTSDDVKGKVTVKLVDVPWDQALMVILQSKSLGAVRYGNIIRIAPVNTISSEREAALKAQQYAKDLEATSVLVVPLNYASVAEVQTQVKSLLSERGKLTTDTRTNVLIIEDVAESLARVQAMLTRLDTQTPEVLIEARVVEASTTFLREFGIQWGGNLDLTANTGNPTGLYFPNSVQLGGGEVQAAADTAVFPSSINSPNWVIDLPSTSSGVALNLALGSLTNIVSLDARLTAIESMGRGKVISSPRITTVDNKEATIIDGARIPYQSISAGGTQVQFIEASLQLTVTPHITADNRVFMAIEVSNNRPDFSNQVQGQPTIEVKEATTEVMVPDGDTTVIGGVYTYTTTESRVGLPFLSRLPVVGWMFRRTSTREDRKELLVFITPHILTRGATAPPPSY